MCGPRRVNPEQLSIFGLSKFFFTVTDKRMERYADLQVRSYRSATKLIAHTHRGHRVLRCQMMATVTWGNSIGPVFPWTAISMQCEEIQPMVIQASDKRQTSSRLYSAPSCFSLGSGVILGALPIEMPASFFHCD